MGIKNKLKMKMSNVKLQVSRNIAHRLSGYPLAGTLATSCLETSFTFINGLVSWMSETQLELTTHGYPENMAWQLVTQIVYHVFSSDLDKARNFVRESLDAQSPKTMALAVLWGTFRTLDVAQEYIIHGFANHHSVSSQYVKFLVTSKGEEASRIEAKLSAELKTMKEAIAKLTQIAKEAKASAAAASNGVDQLKKKEKK